MDEFLRKNKILASIIFILLVVITTYFFDIKNKKYSYQMNIDCSKMAPAFVKQQKDNTLADSWNIELLQTKYSKNRNSCFG